MTDVADRLLKNGTVNHAQLGVVPRDLTPQIAQQFHHTATEGALVVEVSARGPAAQAGIAAGDIITSFAGTKITSSLDLLGALRQHEPGQAVDVAIQRGPDTRTIPVTLGD